MLMIPIIFPSLIFHKVASFPKCFAPLALYFFPQEKTISTTRELLDRSTTRHKKEMSVTKERFDSCLKTSQSLQSYITHLYAKLDSSGRSTNNTKSHNETWTSSSDHSCGDKCKASVDDLDIATSHHHHHRHHEHSHRHTLPFNQTNTSKPVLSSSSSTKTTLSENPFTHKSRAATLSSTSLSVDTQSTT